MVYLSCPLTIFLSSTLTLLVTMTSPAQEVAVELGAAEPLPEQLFTFNSDMATAIMFRGVGYDSPQFEDAVRQLRPQGLRFPGGTLANNYLWSNDSFSQPTNDKTGWAGEQLQLFRKIGRPYDLPGFARVVGRNNVIPIWVLNVYEETPESVLKLFEKLDSLGMKVESVEMANEPYWDGRSMADVNSYIDATRPIAEALKRQRPDLQIGACFAPFENPANYEAIWNAPLSKQAWFDAVVFHEYYGGQGFALEKGERVSAKALQHPEAMVDAPVTKLRAIMPDKPIWFTEWNIGMEGLDQWKNTGAELQFIAAMFASLIEHREAIDIACFHAFYDSRFGPFYLDDESGQLRTNASYELFRMLGTVFADAQSLRPIKLASDNLRGFATQNASDVRLFVLNRGDDAVRLKLPPEINGELAHAMMDCAPSRKLDPSTSHTKTKLLTAEGVTLPPNSINLIGRRETLAFEPATTDDNNLFPRRPDLLFWYPPYASEQPRFNSEGVYTVELAKCKDKSLAVLKMNLASSKLQAGGEYAIAFEAKASVDGPIIVKLPQADTKDGQYCLLNGDYAPLRFTFTFDSGSNDGGLAIVFQEELIAQSPTISLRNFRIYKP